MKLRKIYSFMLLCLSASAASQSTYDQQMPFGFCTVSSRTNSSSTYNITGGGCYEYPVPASVNASKVKILTSTGNDMRSDISNAINNDAYSVIIFDGSNGDFKISSNIGFSGKKQDPDRYKQRQTVHHMVCHGGDTQRAHQGWRARNEHKQRRRHAG